MEGRKFVNGPLIMNEDGSFQSPENQPPISNSNDISQQLQSQSSPPASIPGMSSSINININNNSFKLASFFGGAIICNIPDSFEDVSMVRQVPDHQEVYVDRNSGMSMIIELLSYEDNVTDQNCGEHYFKDLAEYNEAIESVIDKYDVSLFTNFMTSSNSQASTICTLVGRQTVAKLNQEVGTVGDVVQISLAIIRLKQVTTDMLISLNIPLASKDRHANETPVAVPGVSDNNQNNNQSNNNNNNYSTYVSRKIMENVCESIKIVNWALFA